MSMRKFVIAATCVALAGCGSSEVEAPEAEAENAEAQEFTLDSTAMGNIAGTYEVKLADGSVSMQTINPDGTYVDTTADGTRTGGGTWRATAEGAMCFDPEGDEGGRGAPAGRDSKEEKPLQRLESIVSLKKAASKLHRKTRYYAIKRLAVEAIANLLEEPENQARFVELSGMSLFRNLIRTGEVFHQEQKRICAALNNLSKNEKMRRPLYERGLMLIVQDIVEQGNVDLVVSALRALRNCAVPVASDGGIPRAGARAPRQLIEWTSEDIRFISSLLLRSQDVRMSKLLLDIVRFIGGQEDHATDIIRFGGPQLLAKFFEASCSCTALAI